MSGTTPTWLPVIATDPVQAKNVDQFMTTHPGQLIYKGTSQISDVVPGSGTFDTTVNLSLAQKFVCPVTAITRIELNLGAVGLGDNISVTLQTDSGGPSGAVVAGPVIVPSGFTAADPAGYRLQIPLPATGLSIGATYWIVIAATTDVANYVTWYQTAAGSGAATNNGGGWVAQSYNLDFNIFAGAVAGDQLYHTFEDGGKRWTLLLYTPDGFLYIFDEVVGSTQWSVNQLTYDANNNLIGVT